MNCLWCDKEIIIQISWQTIVVPPQQQNLCEECEAKLYELSGQRCLRCSRESSAEICIDCDYWLNRGKDSLEHNFSIFNYNDTMKEMIARWKYRGDYMLGYVFQYQLKSTFEKEYGKLKDAMIIPIPLSEERLQERRFNQAKMLASFIDDSLASENILTRVHSEKQSKRSRQERIQAENPFVVNKRLNKSVVLVDDIYTTGTTLRFAADTLKNAGCPKVYSLTLIRG